MLREDFAARLGEGVVTVTDPAMIRAAWGPRRVSGRTRGMVLSVYPQEVTAARRLWLEWFDRVAAGQPEAVVIAKKKAQARINAALGRVQGDPEATEVEPLARITQEEIDDLMAERAELRATRQFADADRIRDYLVRHGVVVADGRVAG